jgi:hypothetical protein
MAYDFSTGGSSSVTATELIVSVFDQVEVGFYDALYPEILWQTVIPKESVKTDINPGAINYVYRSRDIKGMGQFVQGDPNNIPRVGQVIGQVTVPILDAAVGATLTDAEARRYQYGMQTALAQDYGEIMRKASEYHIERTTFFGNVAAGFQPFLDYSSVSKIPGNAWAAGAPDTWVREINDAITAVWTNSKTIHLPDTVYLPPAAFSMLTEAYVIGTGSVGVAVSALNYLKTNNIYTAMTGKELNIKVLRYLTGAGVAGVDRAIIMESNPRNYVLPFPLAYQLAQPVPVPLGVEMFAEYIFGSFNVRYPLAMAYLDFEIPAS